VFSLEFGVVASGLWSPLLCFSSLQFGDWGLAILFGGMLVCVSILLGFTAVGKTCYDSYDSSLWIQPEVKDIDRPELESSCLE
jgi:hypothetical protein